MEARLSAERMFAELSGPVDGERERILNAFLEGVDPILQVVLAPQSQARGQRAFAIAHLITRSLSDLLAGAHLA